MNKELMLKTADLIEKASLPETTPEIGFNMGGFCSPAQGTVKDNTAHNCSTIACIAGWALLASGVKPEELIHMASDTIENKAMELLDLGYNEAQALFYAYNYRSPRTFPIWEVLPEQAIEALRLSVKNNEITWNFGGNP